jgi:hypothetical protein
MRWPGSAASYWTESPVPPTPTPLKAKTRKRSILKSQPYFACKERHDRGLLAVKRDIQKHESGVKDAKARVAAALKMLETISTEIHNARQQKKAEQEAAAAAAAPVDGAAADPAQDAGNQAALVVRYSLPHLLPLLLPPPPPLPP